MVGWIKYILTTEQKKADFKPESEEGPMQMYSKVDIASCVCCAAMKGVPL